MRESEVESYLRRCVEQEAGRCLKFDSTYCAGMPDRLILMSGGVVVWAETKRPKGGRLSPIQKHRHAELERLGQRVFVVRSKEEAADLVRRIKKYPGKA